MLNITFNIYLMANAWVQDQCIDRFISLCHITSNVLFLVGNCFTVEICIKCVCVLISQN